MNEANPVNDPNILYSTSEQHVEEHRKYTYQKAIHLEATLSCSNKDVECMVKLYFIILFIANFF